MTVTVLARHAHELATAFEVVIIEHAGLRPEDAMAIPALRTVVSSPIIDETIYAVVLHEIGHLVSPLGCLRHEQPTSTAHLHNLMLAEESAAWEWAEHYALEWTPAMQAVRESACQTYVAGPPVRPVAPSSAAPVYPARRVNPDATAFGKSINWKKGSK